MVSCLSGYVLSALFKIIINKHFIRNKIKSFTVRFVVSEIPLSLHFGSLLKKGNFQSRIFKLHPPEQAKSTTKR